MSYRILVVDDSAVSRHMVCRAITMSGLDIGEILEASNGREALDLLGKTWVDIVLADINMPVMSGADMVREMAKRDFMSVTPVIIISSEKSAKRMEEMRELGVYSYLSKPFRPEQIKQLVGKILRERKEAGRE
jgi:two-component system, chemotaxis family, chemotaxis protein CheY